LFISLLSMSTTTAAAAAQVLFAHGSAGAQDRWREGQALY
jgi:hypothetical protein